MIDAQAVSEATESEASFRCCLGMLAGCQPAVIIKRPQRTVQRAVVLIRTAQSRLSTCQLTKTSDVQPGGTAILNGQVARPRLGTEQPEVVQIWRNSNDMTSGTNIKSYSK